MKKFSSLYRTINNIINLKSEDEELEKAKEFINSVLPHTKEILLEDFLKDNDLRFIIPKIDKINRGRGSVVIYETFVLCSVVKALKPKSLLEIGTCEGTTAMNLSMNIEKDSKIYTMDIADSNCKYDPGKYVRNNDKVVTIIGDSQKYDFSRFYGMMDFIFIDGDHKYNSVLSDSENALKCIKDGGFIVWHDFNVKHVGVINAISEINRKYKLKLYKISGTNFVFGKLLGK